MIEYKGPGRYIPLMFLLYSWGSQFGVPSAVPLNSIPTSKSTWNHLQEKSIQLSDGPRTLHCNGSGLRVWGFARGGDLSLAPPKHEMHTNIVQSIIHLRKYSLVRDAGAYSQGGGEDRDTVDADNLEIT